MSKGTILIVEDENDIVDILGEMLEFFGYTPTAVSNGIDAWRQVSAKEYDLVLTDLHLPGMDGIELLTKMRLHDIRTPVLLISGVDLQGRLSTSGNLGQVASIQKPFRIDDLKGKIITLLKNSKPHQNKTKHK
jgi:DNA-binding response OmpR family regulator